MPRPSIRRMVPKAPGLVVGRLRAVIIEDVACQRSSDEYHHSQAPNLPRVFSRSTEYSELTKNLVKVRFDFSLQSKIKILM
jgi:hypothetical protein